MFTEESRNNIINAYLQLICIISDKEYQRRVWIHGEPSGSDFDEIVNLLISIGDPILENYQEFGITDIQYQILSQLRNKFGAFWEENDWPPFFIDTPEWNEIVEMAKEVLKAFDYRK
jgi:hypothetical protein